MKHRIGIYRVYPDGFTISRDSNCLSCDKNTQDGKMKRTVGYLVQPADIEWPTGNGKKLSCSQAQLGQATCLAAA